MCGSAIKIALEKPDDSGENSSALAQQSLENLNTDDARSNAATESRATVVAKSQPLIDTFLLKANVLEGEIIWALENTLNHQSFSSCESLSKLFTRMFSDSKIAEQFSLGKTKCRYYTVFGIASYFKSLLVNSLVITHIIQNQELGTLVRFKSDNCAVQYKGKWANGCFPFGND